jgi:hypothetical protein
MPIKCMRYKNISTITLILLFSSICLISLFLNKGFCLDAKIIKNDLNVKKESINRLAEKKLKQKNIYWAYKNPEWTKNWNEKKGHFKKMQKNVSIITYGGYPDSSFKCFSEQGDLIWSRTTKSWPTNDITAIFFREDNNETTIMVLLHGRDSEYIVFLDEEGRTKNIVDLMASTKKYFLEIEPFDYKEKRYVLLHGYNDAIIYDYNGRVVKALTTPVVTGGTMALELHGARDDTYLVVYVIHKFTTHTATLFILSDKMEIVYEEYITNRRSVWIGTQQSIKGDVLIVFTREDQADENETPKDVIWQYMIGGNK